MASTTKRPWSLSSGCVLRTGKSLGLARFRFCSRFWLAHFVLFFVVDSLAMYARLLANSQCSGCPSTHHRAATFLCNKPRL